jgi:hypothetical protein
MKITLDQASLDELAAVRRAILTLQDSVSVLAQEVRLMHEWQRGAGPYKIPESYKTTTSGGGTAPSDQGQGFCPP